MPAAKPSNSAAQSGTSKLGQVRWLHLSDIHFWGKNDWKDDAARRKLIAMLEKKFANGELPKPDLIFCTGDIAQGETKPDEMQAQYESAKTFFDQVLQVCGLQKSRLFVVPGNHDVNRKNVSESFQDGLRARAFGKVATSWAAKDVDFQDAVRRLNEYGNFVQTYLPHQTISEDEKHRHFYAKTLTINGVRLGIAGFNSAWACFDDKDQNQLWMAAEWQFNQADNAFAGKTDLSIGLMHHPASWLKTQEASFCKQRIRSGFQYFLHGHEHEAWVTPTTKETVICAGAVNASSDSEFGINLVDLNLTEGHGKVHLFSYQKGGNVWLKKNLEDAEDGFWELKFPAISLVVAGEDGNPSPYVDESANDKPPNPANPHPSHQALQKLHTIIQDTLENAEAKSFRQNLCKQLALPSDAAIATLLEKLDAKAKLEEKMRLIQKALLHAGMEKPLGIGTHAQPHAIERAASALYMRAALLHVNLAALEAGCPCNEGLIIVPANSEVLIAILAAATHGELQQFALIAKPHQDGTPKQMPKGECLLDLSDAPFYPLKSEAAFSSTLLSIVDKKYASATPPQTEGELQELQAKIQRRLGHHREVNEKFYRAIVDQQTLEFLRDDAKLAELNRKLGLPFTRVVENNAVDIEQILGVTLAAIEDYFTEFLEVLERAKQSEANS